MHTGHALFLVRCASMGAPDLCARCARINCVAGSRWRRIAVAPELHRTVRCTPDSVRWHRTVRCTPDSVRCPISFLKWRSRPLAAREPLASRWRTGHVRCTPDSPVPPSDRWLSHVSRAESAADRWPGRPLAHWEQIWKAIFAFCLVAHRTVRCTPDTVRCPISFLNRRSRPLPTVADLGAVGAPDMSGAHRTVRCPLPTVGLATCRAQNPRPTIGPSRPLAHRTVRCTPDSPVNFSRSRWRKTRERPLRSRQSGAPDTVRCTIGHCPVHHRTVRCPRPKQPLGCTQPSLLFSSSFCF